ncbi:hypothetical protein SSX86_004898 [Deinandra increscens subsp. villosa]|uniref:RING-type E3 ubiquitin transferase n=1 Tax=Deinandra increscens subsp. villosa TaxID=3103831 RepID=A0AAP0DKF0_9ASTR
MSTNPTHAPPPTIPYTSPPITIVLTVILLLFFFIGFFSIYFCRCFMQNLFYTWRSTRRNPSRAPVGPGGDGVNPGLDPLIISSFPTFTYSSVKEYHRENYGLECAICLCEFRDENVLRLLTKCYHVFHQECIDLWLGSHKSCPCCRCSLDTPINSPEKSPNNGYVHEPQEANNNDNNDNNSVHEDCVTIDVKDNDENEDKDERKKEEKKHVVIEVGPEQDKITQTQGLQRSKSTGHNSTVGKNNNNVGSCEKFDKFMLRLPQDVQDKLIPKHNWTRSCTEFGEHRSKTSSSSAG